MREAYRAIFLDRDGTINEDVGDLCSVENLVFIPNAIDSLRMLQQDFLLFIITNQPGIGKGIFSESEFFTFNEQFVSLLSREGVAIKGVYCCPHTKESNCLCRKPNPFFIEQIQKDFDIDTGNSYVIGDHPHDIEMGHNAGTSSVYLLTGHGQKHIGELRIKPDFIAKSISEAASWIYERNIQE